MVCGMRCLMLFLAGVDSLQFGLNRKVPSRSAVRRHNAADRTATVAARAPSWWRRRDAADGVSKKVSLASKAAAAKASAIERAARWATMRTLVSGDIALLSFAAFFLVCAACFDVAVPHYSSQALNAIIANARGETHRSVRRELMGLTGVSVGAAFCTGLRGASFWIAGANVVARLRVAMFANVMTQELGYFDTASRGALSSRLSSDATKIADVVSFNLNILARQAIQALGGVLYLFWLDAPLAAMALFWISTAACMTDVYGKFARKFARQAQDAVARAASVADEALTNVRVVRACDAEVGVVRTYEQAIALTRSLQTTHGVGYGWSRVALGACRAASTIALLALGEHRRAAGLLDAEKLVSFLFYSSFVNGAAFDVGEQLAKVEEALGAGAAAFDLAHREPTWTGSEAPSSLRNACAERSVERVQGRGRVEFRDVRFSYPARPSEMVLRGVTINIAPGEKVALVGESGSGKSTLARLVLRQYEATEGCVALDGVDVRDVSQKELACRVAYVEQEPKLFEGTIAENIRFGFDETDPLAARANVVRAAELAGVSEFADKLPRGLDTQIGSGGALVSGGQKQRVAIARALLRDPDLIVLDEPSSALDARSEELVQRALDATSCSMLVVAHRLATVKDADRIYVLSEGRVVEQGTHAQLIASEGEYAAMVQMQSLQTDLLALEEKRAPPPKPPTLEELELSQ